MSGGTSNQRMVPVRKQKQESNYAVLAKVALNKKTVVYATNFQDEGDESYETIMEKDDCDDNYEEIEMKNQDELEY